MRAVLKAQINKTDRNATTIATAAQLPVQSA
jgi:hypothetical protein